MSRTLRAIAAAAITGILLAGCAQQPNTAAVVNGDPIKETEVADAWVDLKPVVVETATPAVIVESLIQNRILAPIAAEYNLTVTQEEVAELAAQVYADAVPDPIPDALSETFSFLALANKLGFSEHGAEIQAAYVAAIAEADVTVNPRFGTFNEMGSITAPAYEWIATQ